MSRWLGDLHTHSIVKNRAQPADSVSKVRVRRKTEQQNEKEKALRKGKKAKLDKS